MPQKEVQIRCEKPIWSKFLTKSFVDDGIISGWWFEPTPLKNDGVKVSWDDFPFPINDGKNEIHDPNHQPDFSPPARWGLLDFMSVACSSSPLLSSPLLVSSPLLLSPLLLLLLPAGPQPRPSTPSVPCRTSTTTITAQCSLPDLNREYPRPVFPAGPQPRPSTPSVPCRTSTASIHAKCSLPDLNHDHPRPVFPAGPQPRVSTPKDMPHRVPEDMPDRMLEDMPDRMPEGMPDRMPDRMSDRMPEDMPDRMPDGIPEDMPEHMPEDMPEDMPEHLPEDMPEHLPEDMPEDMPDRMPENMSDRMPEDLPVTKCINVMVGITRSKVIFVHHIHRQNSQSNQRGFSRLRISRRVKTHVIRILGTWQDSESCSFFVGDGMWWRSDPLISCTYLTYLQLDGWP